MKSSLVVEALDIGEERASEFFDVVGDPDVEEFGLYRADGGLCGNLTAIGVVTS
jgi:hypothetical protein